MTKPEDLPPPDLIDSTGRMRRLALSFVIACVCGAIAYFVADSLATPEQMPGGFDGGSKSRAFGFVGYMTGIAFAVSFAISLAIQNKLEKRRYVESLRVPKAQLRK